MKGLIVTTENEMRLVDYAPPYDEIIREAVGGWYEHVLPRRLPRPYCMMVDEGGRLKDLPLNPLGSYLYQTDIHGDPIVGDIILLKDDLYAGEPDVIGMTEEEAHILADRFIAETNGLIHWAEKSAEVAQSQTETPELEAEEEQEQ